VFSPKNYLLDPQGKKIDPIGSKKKNISEFAV